MARHGTHYATPHKYDLTRRQLDVLRLIERGYTNAEIAHQLGITLDGAKFHVSEILSKLGVASREDAVARWRESGGRNSRIRSWLGALSAGTLAKVAGIAAATAVAIGLAALYVNQRDDSQPVPLAQVTPGQPGPLGEVVATVPIGGDPYSIAAAGGFVWVGDRISRQITKVDPATNQIVGRLPIDSTSIALAEGGGSLWAAAPELELLLRIDPATNDVVAMIPFWRGLGPSFGYTNGVLWAGRPTLDYVERINTTTNTSAGTVPTGPNIVDLAVHDGQVFVVHQNGDVMRIDPATNRVTQRFSTVPGVESMSVTSDALWLLTGESVIRVDMATGQIVATAAVSDSSGIVASTDGVWVNLRRHGAIARLAPGTNTVLGTILVGLGPRSVIQGSNVWTATRDGSLTRIDSTVSGASAGIDVVTPVGTVLTPHGIPDFVRLNGITYLFTAPLGGEPPGRALRTEELGPQIGSISFKAEGNVTTDDYRPKNGDAGFLEPGTALYEVKGYASTFRIAAMQFGELRLYEASENPLASTGADYLDVRGRVTSIALVPPSLPRREVRDPTLVALIIEIALLAPVEPDAALGGLGPETYVEFSLADGTMVRRRYDIEARLLEPNVRLPAAFYEALVR